MVTGLALTVVPYNMNGKAREYRGYYVVYTYALWQSGYNVYEAIGELDDSNIQLKKINPRMNWFTTPMAAERFIDKRIEDAEEQ